jgi:preprotein translocase subunit SecF
LLKFQGVDEETHQKVLAKINEAYPVTEKSFQYIGPSVGKELRNKTQVAIALVCWRLPYI